MTINFAAAVKAAEADVKSTKLAAVILGAPSAGKSALMNSFGVKTLFLYMSGESHGPQSASTYGSGELVPYCVCRDDNGKQLSPDESLKRLRDVLAADAAIKDAGIKAIALDGLTELEFLIQESSEWKARVDKERGGNTSFAGAITVSMVRPYLDQLRTLQRTVGIHYAVSCILDVSSYGEAGEVLECMPKLKGYDVALGIILQFPDRLIVGHMSDGESELPRLQMKAIAHKETKDFKTKVVRKTHNFRVQIAGVDTRDFPATLKPDLSRIMEFKAAGTYVKREVAT